MLQNIYNKKEMGDVSSDRIENQCTKWRALSRSSFALLGLSKGRICCYWFNLMLRTFSTIYIQGTGQW